MMGLTMMKIARTRIEAVTMIATILLAVPVLGAPAPEVRARIAILQLKAVNVTKLETTLVAHLLRSGFVFIGSEKEIER